jgi:hypothetical protein
MKNSIQFVFVFILALLFCNDTHAQRSFIGGGITFMNRNQSYTDFSSEYSRKYNAVGTTLSYTRYSSPRRGYAFNVTPFLTGTGSYSEIDNGTGTKGDLKSTGYAVGLSVFGLLGSDYQSKVEWGLINNAGFDIHPGAEFINASLDFGVMARFRLNSKMKIHTSFYPLKSSFSLLSFNPVFGVQFLYAPI